MSQNRSIAKNTILLYIRMVCSVCISLYTSRLILQTLGVDDFGIYNIIGGIVALLGFLNTSMAGCTSRFFAYELGCGNASKLKSIFNTAFIVHIYIALFIFIFGETFGLWFINSQLVIPESRLAAANVVYQFSLLTALISFLQVPYTALTIAHERMDAYAFMELLNMFLRLSVVLLLTCLFIDKLITYSMLLTVVALVILLAYRFFCNRNFTESSVKFALTLDRETLLPMLKFTSWDIYGNLCVLIQQQGLNVIINRFFGVALNAATGVATQASSAVSMFVSSFTMALRPPLIKKYAMSDWNGIQRLLVISIVLCAFLAEIVCVPLYLRINDVMKLWLVNVPLYATDFCKWMLLANSVSVINNVFVALIHATGDIKRLSIITGTMYISTVLFSYLAFKLSYSPVIAYTILFIIAIITLFNNVFIIARQIPELSCRQILKDIIIPFLSLGTSAILSVLINNVLDHDIWGIILLFISNIFIAFCLLYVLWLGPRYGWNFIKLVICHEV